jgi:hypothetical protein
LASGLWGIFSNCAMMRLVSSNCFLENLDMREAPVVTDLPGLVLREIGRIIVLQANLEYVMGRIVYDILDIDVKRGRVAVRDPRPKETLEMIYDLLRIENITMHGDWKPLQRALESTSQQRDYLAHGIWLRHSQTDVLHMRIIGGTWQPDPRVKARIKRRILPESSAIGLEYLKGLSALIETTIETAMQFHADVTALLRPLRNKRKQRSRRRDLRRLLNRAKRKPSDRSSRGSF